MYYLVRFRLGYSTMSCFIHLLTDVLINVIFSSFGQKNTRLNRVTDKDLKVGC